MPSKEQNSDHSSKLGAGIAIGVGISAVAALAGLAIWQRDKIKEFALEQKAKLEAKKCQDCPKAIAAKSTTEEDSTDADDSDDDEDADED